MTKVLKHLDKMAFNNADLGLLRAKMSELNAEMARLSKEVDKNNKEQQSLPSLEKKVKEMALEITGKCKTFSIGKDHF